MITLTAKITLADGTEVSLNKQNLINLDANIIDRADTVLPSWGIISNRGKISFVDRGNRIKVLAQDLKLNSKTKIVIFLNDTLANCSTPVGEFFSESWDYENNNSTVNVNVTDGLMRMQDIIISPLKFDIRRGVYTTDTAKEIYDFLHKQTVDNGFNMLSTSNPNFDTKTLNHLKNISIAFPYVEETNLWRAWEDFAIAFQLHIYKNSRGEIVCIYYGGD